MAILFPFEEVVELASGLSAKLSVEWAFEPFFVPIVKSCFQRHLLAVSQLTSLLLLANLLLLTRLTRP